MIRIHLIKSEEVNEELFTNVINLLSAVPGAISFSCDPDSIINFDTDELFEREFTRERFEKMKEVVSHSMVRYEEVSFPVIRNITTWDTLFKKSADYRRSRKIPDTEFVLLLTDIPNYQNWFAALDEKMPMNGFVHTNDWEHFISCSPAFPIAYEVVALTLQRYMFNGFAQIRQKVHITPVGCMNDMCLEKREIILKLRTADICQDCSRVLREKLPAPVIHHAIAIMESLRVKMLFAQNFRQESKPSRLLIDQHYHFFLPDFGNIELKLRPLEKALYILFLRHPEGILMSSLSDHRDELYGIYASMSSRGMAEEMKARIQDMTNALSNSASEKISRIRRVITEAIGTELARHYIIQGNSGDKKKIALNRSLITDEIKSMER
jgi:hypothetical protein